MAAAVDEAAQTMPTVSPFDPAVRDLRMLHYVTVNFVNYTALPGPVISQGTLVPLKLSLDGN